MSRSLLQNKRSGRPDNFQTPDWPVISLLNALPEPLKDDSVVWDPCCGKGNIVKLLKRMNQSAFGSDIVVTEGCPDWMVCRDFLDTNYDYNGFDYIITNPPYSIKDKFIQRCYDLGKPWALLMPMTALGEQKRFEMYKENGLQVVLLPKRVNFETPSGEGSGSHFCVAWFTWGFNFERDITYA